MVGGRLLDVGGEFPATLEVADSVRTREPVLAVVTTNLVDVDDLVDQLDQITGIVLIEFVSPVDGVAERHGVDRSPLAEPIRREPTPGADQDRVEVEVREQLLQSLHGLGVECAGSATHVCDLGRSLGLPEDRRPELAADWNNAALPESERIADGPDGRPPRHVTILTRQTALCGSIVTLGQPVGAFEGGPVSRLPQDKFRVFVSHKSDDAELAEVVAEELRNLAPDRIECWVSGEALTAGMDWEREIKKQLAQSHLLVLLFTTPQHTWDWCLYEVGLYVRFDVEDVTSVACLFDPSGSPPAPLNQVQCVRASSDRIAKQLLRPLCTQTWDMSDTWQRGALLPTVSDDVVTAAAERIAETFDRHLAPPASGSSDDRYRYRPCHRIVLDLEHCVQTPPWNGIPRHARVVTGRDDTTSYTLSLFRAHDGKAAWTWGDLVEEVEGTDAPWLRDLDQSFLQSLSRHLWSPSMELMEVWQPDAGQRRTYRPIVYEVVRQVSDDAPVEVTILLLPDDWGVSD